MKWPSSITLVRHGESDYNRRRRLKDKDERYKLFKRAFNKNSESTGCRALAEEMHAKYAVGVSDYETELTADGRIQAAKTGTNGKRVLPKPDVVFISPYRRTVDTFDGMRNEWPELCRSKLVYEDRLREQEHGLALLYGDWRIFHVFHPEQRALRRLLGPYWYQFPQGESVSQVRDRYRSLISTLIREWAGMHVMLVTHHLTILSARGIHERLRPEEFIWLDEYEKPINCGVTLYRGDPNAGKDGKLELEFYNRCLWKEKK